MTDIQQARDVLAKWRAGVTGPIHTNLPWTVQNATPGRKNWDDVLVDADGDWVFSYDEESPGQDEMLTWNRPGSADPAAVRLIVGTAGNPDLLDALGHMLDQAPYEQLTYQVDVARIAAAIIAADKRMTS